MKLPIRHKTRQTEVVSTPLPTIVCVVGLASSSAWGQGDPLPGRGHGTVSVAASAFTSRAGWDDDGVAILMPDVDLRALALESRATLGIGERLGLGLGLPLVLASSHARDGAVAVISGPGDATVGLTLDDGGTGPLRLALRGEVKVPLYTGAPALQGRQPPTTDETLPGPLPALGDGQVDVTIGGLLVAHFPFGGFFSWEQGYRFRTGGVTDGVVGVGRVAVPAPGWLLDGRLVPRWDHAFLFSFDPPRDDDGRALEVIGRSLVVTGPGCTVLLPELSPGLAVDVGAALLFRGRNAAGGVRLDLGVSHAF